MSKIRQIKTIPLNSYKNSVKSKAYQHISHILLAVIVIALSISSVVLWNVFQKQPYDQLPCHYFHSVNISGGIQRENGSITFDNITYPKHLYGEMDKVIRYDEFGEPFYEKVAPYLRGCICNITNCMHASYVVDGISKWGDNAAAYRVIEPDLNTDFKYIYENPCVKNIEATPDEINITDTGIVIYDGIDLNPDDLYRSYDINEGNVTYFICYEKAIDYMKIDIRVAVLPYVMQLSVAFIVATILLYIYMRDIRNLHGKCMMCYLLSLAFGYGFMSWLYINGNDYVEPIYCNFVAYSMYFSFESAFLWLNVICFDLWWTIWNTIGFALTAKMRLCIYTSYTFTISLLLVFIVFEIDQNENIPEEYKPQMGVNQCFFGHEFLPMFLYFYLPFFISTLLNIVFFILVAFRIHQIKHNLSKFESKKHQNHEDNFILLLRLFILMGSCWIMEAISFFVDPKSMSFFVFDFWNCSQGILIFVSTLFKQRVQAKIKKRFFAKRPLRNGSIITNISLLSVDSTMKFSHNTKSDY
ncbi:G-protein coupled receptor Mth2-like [Contarinia nasturtii]|uniref:G-protein coupled receptor Mth2-like n=1 Tax=Contarinia nasturtii TaxID=265458 RepID=UPI0012D3CCF2|nr:G-protein coupled receptor Mth2-like [Contarinia nasturtii]